MIRVIAFDLDDTLWAVRPVIIRAEKKLTEFLETAATDYRHDPDHMRAIRDEVVTMDPGVAHQLTELRRRVIARTLESSGMAPGRAARLADDAMEVFLAARNEIEFFAGVEAALDKLSQEFTLGALTNGNADIRRVGLDRFFSFAFSAEQVGAPKPAPDLFQAALEHNRIEPGHMIYVGDDPALDVDAANRLGIHTIWKENPEKSKGATQPSEAINHLDELPAAVAAILARL